MGNTPIYFIAEIDITLDMVILSKTANRSYDQNVTQNVSFTVDGECVRALHDPD